MPKVALTQSERWLLGFADEQQKLVASWFRYAVTAGAKHPEAILEVVDRVVRGKAEWATVPETRMACAATLSALACDELGAKEYAASVLKETQRGA